LKYLLSLSFLMIAGMQLLFGVDANIKIEKDVEQRARIALVDGSESKNETFFQILLSDLKISGHFLADTTYRKGDVTSEYLLPELKNREYVLKYALSQDVGSRLLIRLIRSSDNKELYKKDNLFSLLFLRTTPVFHIISSCIFRWLSTINLKHL